MKTGAMKSSSRQMNIMAVKHEDDIQGGQPHEQLNEVCPLFSL
jgi:hypothetical protein